MKRKAYLAEKDILDAMEQIIFLHQVQFHTRKKGFEAHPILNTMIKLDYENNEIVFRMRKKHSVIVASYLDLRTKKGVNLEEC